MSQSAPQSSGFFVSGGTLRPTSPSYVERAADREFFERLSAGDFCYVLTSRQMGKSSLMARTAVKLREVGALTAVVDLTSIGDGAKGNASAATWYFGIARAIARELGLKADLKSWWQERDGLPEQQRLAEFLEDFVLGATSQRVVIFVDEIDATLRLPFTDDFFAGIRACYNARANTPAFERLTFALLGVASPSELIKDTSRTPFNIGHRIELADFTLDEARPLAAGFPLASEEAVRALGRVLHWTGGQPYLTQKLCLELSHRLNGVGRTPRAGPLSRGGEEDRRTSEGATTEPIASAVPEAGQGDSDLARRVDDLVQELLFSPEGSRDEVHFKYIRDRLRQDPHQRRVLLTYRKVLGGERVPDNPQSLFHNSLKLAGLVQRATDGHLEIRNPIYRRVFDQTWVKNEMPADIWKRAAIAASTTLAIGAALWFLWLSPRLATQATMEAEIFGAVRTIAFAKSEIPTSERKLLERYSDKQIARSILKGKERVADVGLTEDQYQSLLKYTSTPQIAKKLWDDYWQRQTEALQALTTKLVTNPGGRAEIDKTMADFKATTASLQQGLSQGEQITTRIHDVAGKAMTKAVKALWDPIDLGISGKPTEAEVTRAATAVSNLGAKWEALAELAGGLVPLVDGDTLKDDFALLLHGPLNQRQNIKSADAAAEKRLSELLKQSTPLPFRIDRGVIQPSGEQQSRFDPRVIQPSSEQQSSVELGVLALNYKRMEAYQKALDGMLRNSDRPILPDMGFIICAEMESAQDDSFYLSTLGNAVGSVATRLEAKAAEPLVARGAALLAKAMESAQEKDPSEISTLGGALASLASQLGAKEAAPFEARGAAVLAKVMESGHVEGASRLSRLGSALAVLTARLGAKETVALAARGATVLVKAMESPEEKDTGDLSALSRPLASLASQLDAKEAAPLAERLAKVMESAQGTDSRDLSALGSALASLTTLLDVEVAAPLTARGAAVLAKAMESPQEKDSSDLSALGSALASLTTLLDVEVAAPLAARGGAVLAKAMESPQEEVPNHLVGLGRSLVELAAPLHSEEAAPLAARGAAVLAKAMESSQDKNPGDLSALGGALAALTARLDVVEAAPLTARGAAVLAKAMEREDLLKQYYGHFFLSQLGLELAALTARLGAVEAVPLAARGAAMVAKGMESPQQIEAFHLSQLGRALASLSSQLGNMEAVPLAARGVAILAKAMESAHPQGKYSFQLEELGNQLVSLAARLNAKEAAPLAEQVAKAMEGTQEKDSILLSELGSALASLAARLDVKEAGALAARGAAVLAEVMESPQDNETIRLSRLGGALASLAARLDAKEAALLAERLVKALESPQNKDSSNLEALGRALASLAAQLDAKEAAPLAARGAAVLTKVMESGQVEDADTLSELGSALVLLAARLDAVEAASLAARGTALLAKAMENPQERDSDALVGFGLSLVPLIAQLEPRAAAAVAGSAVTRMIQTLDMEEPATMRRQAAVISFLAEWMEPTDAATIAPRSATVLTQRETYYNKSSHSDSPIVFGLAAASLAARLPPEEAARFAPPATALIMSDRPSALTNFLVWFRPMVGPKASTILIQDWINAAAKLQESQPARREKLGSVIEVLRKELSARP